MQAKALHFGTRILAFILFFQINCYSDRNASMGSRKAAFLAG